MLSTILASKNNRRGERIVVRQQNNIAIDNQERFMTHIETEAGVFCSGNYDMAMDAAFIDFLERAKREGCEVYIK